MSEYLQISKPLYLLKKLVHPARFERATSAFGGQRSIQLSYGCGMVGMYCATPYLPVGPRIEGEDMGGRPYIPSKCLEAMRIEAS